MFRLIKLVMMGLIGYAIYEFFRGLMSTQAVQQMTGGGGAGQGRQDSPPNIGAGNMQYSGPGEGQRVETEDAAGAGSSHYVGRGVVAR